MSEQSKKALALANRTRLAAATLKQEVHEGEVTIPDALFDPRAGCLSVYDLLRAQRRWGRRRVEKFLGLVTAEVEISRGVAERRLRDVPDRVRRAIAQTYSESYDDEGHRARDRRLA